MAGINVIKKQLIRQKLRKNRKKRSGVSWRKQIAEAGKTSTWQTFQGQEGQLKTDERSLNGDYEKNVENCPVKF